MPDVIAWPPLGITAYEHTLTRPVQRETGLDGEPYLSQSLKTRRTYTARTSGIGPDRFGAGYVEILKHLLDGKLALVSVPTLPRVWMGAVRAMPDRGADQITWVTPPEPVTWQDGSAVGWINRDHIIAVAGADQSGFNYIDCTGLPVSQTVAAPGEAVSIAGDTAYVLRPAKSNEDGEARVYLTGPLTSGNVRIGVIEVRTFEIPDFPRAQQPVNGDFFYEFQMREVFDDDFDTPLQVINPWS
ncbi:hypothetical protein GCM10007385_35560 [Tateyamaria omphalii]|uniref:hypothetical protein n=1 Tax=Tateyamaria omphalii TaxID=299262 RepID=UPI0016770E68|nr:hypothetical protein [Tateyamaria omphalii]GGX63316.1 hypothetical protein GCM10007385_35560 [Tateyamaria omphalii]